MKLPHCSLATVLLLPSLFAQTSPKSIDGLWQGALLFGQGKVRVVFHISPLRDGLYTGAMVILDLGAGDEIQGKFTERETSGSLTLTRTRDTESNAADAYEKHEYMIPVRDGIHLHTTV